MTGRISYSSRVFVLLTVALVSSACQTSSARSVADGAPVEELVLAVPRKAAGAALAQAPELGKAQPALAQPALAQPTTLAQAPEPAEAQRVEAKAAALAQAADPAAAQPVEAKPAALAQVNPALLKELRSAVQGSPYVAVLDEDSIEVSRKGARAEAHQHYARVVETFRGPKLDKIDYVVITKPGTIAELKEEPTIVTLCRDAEGYYRPGVGSTFPSTAETRAVAREAAKQAPRAQQKFSKCE